MRRRAMHRTSGVGLALAALTLLPGCAHVNEEQLAAEMDVLRQEMRAGDQAVENSLNARMDGMETDIDARIAGLEADLDMLADEFDVTVERLESAVRFNTPVHFDFAESTVLPESREALDRFAAVLSSYYQDAVITVEGFADPSGSAQYNLALGQRRAEAVRDYLSEAGIPASRMRAVSYGEAPERQIVPGAQGPGNDGWQNRRASIVIDFDVGMPGEPAV